MSFVIYHKETTKILKGSIATERAAKGQKTKLANKGKINADEYEIAESGDYFTNIEKTKIVRSLMSGKEVEISVNTPISCDPSSETYWSM